MLRDDEAHNERDLVFDSIDEVFALFAAPPLSPAPDCETLLVAT